MRRSLSVILLVASAPLLAAQSDGPRIGLSGGATFAHIEGSQVSDISNRTGPRADAYVAFPLSGGWSLQTGAFFSANGWQRKEPQTQDLAVVKLDYVEVPLLVRYDFGGPHSIGVTFNGGTAAAFRTHCALEATTHSTGVTQSASCDEVRQLSNGTLVFNSMDWDLVGGAGLRIPAGAATVIAALQYQRGLTQIEKSNDARSRATSLSLGLEFPLRRR